MSGDGEALPCGGRTGTIIVDAMLLGLGRRLLLEQTDPATADALVMRVGRAQGWRLAGRDRRAGRASDDIWGAASSAAMSIGLGRPAPALSGSRAGVLPWEDSAEAAHHRVTSEGQSPTPVCWFLAGFFAGYVSRLKGRINCVEERCVAQGAPACVFVGTPVVRAPRRPAAEALPEDGDATTDDPGLGVRSAHMQVLVSHASRVAAVNSTVLITGESGVGKNRLARFIHDRSERAKRAFLPLNCAALSDALLESELFGHKRGAFTGADHDHMGLFEAAAGGTLFLDEIGDVSSALQIKLLAVLQDRQLRRVGETHYRRMDVRVIAATNRNLEQEVRAGRFRADFYYRLAVVCLHVPPLRERPEDLALLLHRILKRTAQGLSRPITGYTARALRLLQRYHWPGNIRELENAIEAACASATGSLLDLVDLPISVRQRASSGASEQPQTLRAVRRAHILLTLEQCDNNKRLAARRLGISITTLRRELQGLDDDAFEMPSGDTPADG